MITIKRSYLDETKEILKKMNGAYYMFNTVEIIFTANADKSYYASDIKLHLKFTDINFIVNNHHVLTEIISALNDVKSIDYVVK